MRVSLFFLALSAGVTLIAAAGCGTSGSNPTLYPEVLFLVEPVGGQATFSVTSLVADGVVFGFRDGTTFTTAGPFSFYLEGAAPSYSGTFVQQGNTAIKVTVHRNRSLVFNANNITSGDGTMVTVTAVDQGTPVSPPPTTQMVRFDVCAPRTNPGSCSTTNDDASNDAGGGITYSGNLGDPHTSHELLLDAQLPRTTPSIYFLQNARDNASAVFQPGSHQLLQAQLFVDNDLKQTSKGTSDDVVINYDL